MKTVATVVLLASIAGRSHAASPLAPGTYRLEMRVVSHANVPLIGAARSTMISTSLVHVRATDAGLEQTHRTCDARLAGAMPFVRMEMPARFIAALGTPTYPIAVDWEDGGWHYRADLGVEYVGWRASDSTPLPTDPDDPGVYDWDGDGLPAATLRLVVPVAPDGELYVVQRGHSVLEGRMVSADRVEGRVRVVRFEQAVVGARPAFLRRAPEVTQEPERSRFHLERVAPDAACENLLRERPDA